MCIAPGAAKQINVRQVDLAVFKSDQRFTSVTTYVNARDFEAEGQIDLAIKEASRETMQSLPGRLGEVETSLRRFDVLPKGTILPFFGELASLQDSDWVLCNAENSQRYPGLVPDLTDRFLEGAGADVLGKTGGRKDIPGDGGHTPSGTVGVGKNRNARDGNGWQGEGGDCMLPSTSFTGTQVPNHNHGGDNRPPYFTVNWIIKIKQQASVIVTANSP